MHTRRSPRPARLPLAWLTFLGSIGVVAGLIGVLVYESSQRSGAHTAKEGIVVFCAAGLKSPVEEAAREYQKTYGVEIQLQYGGSNTLLANLQVSGKADLYIPADENYVETARERGLINEVLPLAEMRPVLAVKKGNPKKIRSFDDLLSRPIQTAQANPEAAAIGKLVAKTLKEKNLWDKFKKHILVNKPTVNDVAGDIALGSVDAGFVWDVTITQVKGLEVVPVDLFTKASARLSACVTKSSEQPTAVLHFARYLAAKDRGLPVFAKYGFVPVEGDRWSESPELKLFAGAMLRPAIDKTVTAFEEREGVKVTRVYNGCGILVAQMRTGKEGPDAYFACDQEFMDKVQDLFDPAMTISGNQLVILVHKGNPHKIRKLKDLAKPGLRVGVGHEKQCAMGALTQETLKQDGSQTPVMKNVKVQSPSGDMLVNQMLPGSLDAVVAYISNAAGHKDKLEAIPIDIPCAFANQPYAVGKSSKYKNLMNRLLSAIRSAESKERFEAYGFTWKVPGAKSK